MLALQSKRCRLYLNLCIGLAIPALVIALAMAFGLGASEVSASRPMGTAPSVPRSQAISGGNLVISQVYGGGGQTGATYRNDFVELFNPATSPVNVNSWSLQTASG